MRTDDDDREMAVRFRKLVGGVISLMLVSEWVLLAASALVVRAIFSVGSRPWKLSLPDRERRRYRAGAGQADAVSA
jgi:hypothetical protein